MRMELLEPFDDEGAAEKFSDAQLKALSRLVAGNRNYEVAEEVGVALGTLMNWRCQPAFKAELKRLQEICYQDSIDALRGASLEAAFTLTEIMRDTDNAPRDRLTAAKAILGQIKFDASKDAAIDPTSQIVRILEDMNK